MKRILLLICVVLAGFGTNAQNSLSILNLNTMVWGSVDQSIVQTEGTIENTNGSAPINVKVMRMTIDTVPGTDNYFCWDQCYEPPVSVSPTAITIQPGQRVEQFYADYKPNGQEGVSTLAYCFYDQSNEADSVCATVRFLITQVGIEDVFMGNESGISSSYPNPASSVAKINYALKAGWQQAKIVVYSMLGSKVREIKLGQDQGTLKLNVSSLPSGMYFYTLVVDDQEISTKKMLVTK
ncbi:MAG: T9SS type A sorting domain-containing protein [Flavobacteriales bacterium]|nr:T9SS type A sorting domain-containing protein [Flavobacteriales bacterium]